MRTPNSHIIGFASFIVGLSGISIAGHVIDLIRRFTLSPP